MDSEVMLALVFQTFAILPLLQIIQTQHVFKKSNTSAYTVSPLHFSFFHFLSGSRWRCETNVSQWCVTRLFAKLMHILVNHSSSALYVFISLSLFSLQ